MISLGTYYWINTHQLYFLFFQPHSLYQQTIGSLSFPGSTPAFTLHLGKVQMVHHVLTGGTNVSNLWLAFKPHEVSYIYLE